MKKNNIRSKISEFLKSEEGRVGVKSPLALGVASASVLLAQAMVTPLCSGTFDVCPLGAVGRGAYCMVWVRRVECREPASVNGTVNAKSFNP